MAERALGQHEVAAADPQRREKLPRLIAAYRDWHDTYEKQAQDLLALLRGNVFEQAAWARAKAVQELELAEMMSNRSAAQLAEREAELAALASAATLDPQRQRPTLTLVPERAVA